MAVVERKLASLRTASSINIALGGWLVVSPWVFLYFPNADARWNSVAVGILIVVIAANGFATPVRSVGASGLNVLLGLWTIASPWIWGYSANVTARWDCVAIGIVIAVLAGEAGLVRRTYAREAGAPPTTAH